MPGLSKIAVTHSDRVHFIADAGCWFRGVCACSNPLPLWREAPRRASLLYDRTTDEITLDEVERIAI